MLKKIYNALRKRFIAYLTKDVFRIVTADQLFEQRPDGIYINGERLPDEKAEQLKSDAKLLLNSVLWEEVLEKPLVYDACRRMFEEGTNNELDIYLGRIQLHVIRTQKELLKSLIGPAKEIEE